MHERKTERNGKDAQRIMAQVAARFVNQDATAHVHVWTVPCTFAVFSLPQAKVSAYDLASSYMRPFEMAIVEGGAAGVMCSYNLLNGKPTCGNPDLTSILRDEWGFKCVKPACDTHEIRCNVDRSSASVIKLHLLSESRLSVS
eukprot:2192417-Pleurochrysis_carterae.AAC.2